MKQDIIQIIEVFNYDNIKYKIDSQSRLLKYNKILQILLHIINAINIILAILSETKQDKIIYAVIVCIICNSIINFEILKCHSKIQNNTKVINDFLKYEKNEMYIPQEKIVGRYNINTPNNSNHELINI